MITVDYAGYLSGQTAWAKILIDLSKTEDMQKSHDFTELAKHALDRTLNMKRELILDAPQDVKFD